MALIIGLADCSTGMAKRIYDAMSASAAGVDSSTAGIARQKEFAYALATAIVNGIKSDATVTINGTGLVSATGGPVTGTATGGIS